MAQKAIKRVYDGKLAKGDLDADTWKMNTEYLANSLNEGTIEYSDEQKDLVATIRRNIHVFAAFKNHKNIADMVDALTVSGKLRAFDDFKVAASSIYAQYNEQWLETEYNSAIAGAQMALKWQDMEKNADIFPMLRYEAIQDDRTRTSHAALHGITLPFGHEFWDEYLPPNGWGCRCSVRQVAGEETSLPKNLPGVDPVFRFNAGKAKAVLNDQDYKTGLSKQQQQNVLEAMYRLIAIEQKGFSTSLDKANNQLRDAAQDMGLTPEETAAVHFYTTAGFQNLNLRLRVGKRSDQDWAIENLIKKAFEKLPKHEGRVWRIVPLQGPKLIETLKVAAQSKEKLWLESAFTSSSAEQSFVEKFANLSMLSVIYEIESKNGRKIAKFSEKGDILKPKKNQHEVLFLPNSRFEIEEFTNITENIFFVKMKEL
jgi:SPP1 gp7 family putative phage head morphogenesis protein